MGWPTNRQGRISARAHLYDAAGRRVTATTYEPYRKGEQPYRPELKPEFNNPDLTVSWHAEADLAADIRDSGLQTAVVYLNIRRCGDVTDTAPSDPMGCSENFQHILPRDVVVYIHTIPKIGMPSRVRVVGTGEGIA